MTLLACTCIAWKGMAWGMTFLAGAIFAVAVMLLAMGGRG